MSRSFRCNNGAYLNYVSEDDENIDRWAFWIERNYMLVLGAAGQMLYEKFEDYEKYHTGVTSIMLVPGVQGIYFIEKTPELLKQEDDVSEDILAVIPNKNGHYFPLRKKEELSLKECAREICAIILNHCYMIYAEQEQPTIEQMHVIAGLYMMDSEQYQKTMES